MNQHYKDETSVFYEDPEKFMREFFDDESPNNRFHWPQFFVIFEALLNDFGKDGLSEYFENKGYNEVIVDGWTIFKDL